MHFDLTRHGIAIPAGALNATEFSRLKRRLTVTSIGFGDRRLTMQCFRIDRAKRMMYIARMRGALELNALSREAVARGDDAYEVRAQFAEGDALSADVSTAPLTLLDYQVPIVRFLTETAMSEAAAALGVSSCYLDLQPGKGKTFIIMALIRHFGRRALIIVPGKELVVQTVKTLRATFPQLVIGEYWSERKTDGDIVVMTTRSAATASEYTFKSDGRTVTMTPDEYFGRFGFTGMDEVHTYCTKEQQEIFWRCQSRYTFACSGTSAEREDKMDEVAYMHVGKPISGERLMAPVLAARAAAAAPVPEWRFQAHCLRYNGPAEFTETLTSSEGTVSCPRMISQFSKDPWRAQWLVDTVRECVSAGHQVFVMLDRTELAKLAWDYLRTAFTDDEIAVTPGVQAAGIVTGKTARRVREAARQSRVVVGSYACIGTGLSWDEFSAAVFWHPRRRKWGQFLNRIFREGGDRARERVAYFLQDNATSIKTQYQGFKKMCVEERGTEPKVTVRSWTDIQVTPEIRKVAEDFAAWDAAQQARRTARDQPETARESSDSEFDEGLD